MARTAWPAATGAARECGRLVQSTVCPAEELPPASPAETVGNGRTPDGRFAAGNPFARHARVTTEASQ
jgi:hypothetical protein